MPSIETLAHGAPGKQFHLPSLDGIRAICIVLVIGSHATQSYGFPSSWKGAAGHLVNGQVGVLIFFVLSGFLITFLMAREEEKQGSVRLRDFYARRLIRIVPVYLAYLAALAVLDLTTALDVGSCGYLTALTYTKNYGCGQWVDIHLWSLAVEEQFYLLWPATFVFLRRKHALIVAGFLVTAAPVFRVLFHVAGYSSLRLFSFPANADALMIGSLAALAVHAWPQRTAFHLSRFTRAGRFVAAVAIYAVWIADIHVRFGYFIVPFGTTVQAIAAAYLIVSFSTVEGGILYRLLNLRAVRYVGLLSYSLYIWQ